MANILFRLDATTAIGTGHLMRSLTLANALVRSAHARNYPLECYFYTQPLPQTLTQLVKASGFKLLTTEQSFASIAPITALKPLCVIVDHYQLDARWEQQLSDICRVIILDDLANRPHQANCLIDQGPLRQACDYQPLINHDCELLLGREYILLRPEFAQRRKSNTQAFRHGFICYGGADPVHATLQTLQTLQHVPAAQQIHWQVVAGAANPDWLAISHNCAQSSLSTTLVRHEPNIGRQLYDADIAIGAAGGMMWERCCIGVPTLAVPIVDNQFFNQQVIEQFELAQVCSLEQLKDPTVIANAFHQLANDREGYRMRNQQAVDGHGARRVAEHLLNSLGF